MYWHVRQRRALWHRRFRDQGIRTPLTERRGADIDVSDIRLIQAFRLSAGAAQRVGCLAYPRVTPDTDVCCL